MNFEAPPADNLGAGGASQLHALNSSIMDLGLENLERVGLFLKAWKTVVEVNKPYLEIKSIAKTFSRFSCLMLCYK